ncbi:MAG TPA: T9SS type A sorting domain-containing protein, partial [Elusimicrobiota bacterium]|nr:T9SS type A sorting domain-containing protein [Elusimicrobiota bacterium]
PNDALADASGSVYVADTGNGRVRVFAAGGAVLRDIPIGSRGSQPWGVALSTAGLWVSDRTQRTVALYTITGSLIKTISNVGRVRGAALDHAAALYVADPPNNLIEKFDPNGSPLLNFGSIDFCRLIEDFLQVNYLSDPTDAAIGPDGALWVADSAHDRIVRYGLQSSSPGRFGFLAVSAAATPASAPAASKAPASRTLDAVDGGAVVRDDGTGVSVPPAVLSGPLQITVQTDASADADAQTRKRLADGIAPASDAIDYEPSGTTFSAPVTLTLSYDPTQLAAQGLNENQLQVYYWNDVVGDWQALASTVDNVGKTVSAQTGHFSVYQVMGAGGGIGVETAAQDAFGLRAAYVFPNPVRGVGAVTIRIQPGLADSVEVNVYDVTGRRVHSSSDFHFAVLNDGNGLGPQDSYDHVWNVSGVGSGVYMYVITAKKAGQADIHKSGKIGIVK